MRRWLIGAALVLVCKVVSAEDSPAELRAELRVLRDRIDVQQQFIERQSTRIEGQQRQLDSLQRSVTDRSATTLRNDVEGERGPPSARLGPAVFETDGNASETAGASAPPARPGNSFESIDRISPGLGERSNLPANVRVGYADGFFIASQENAKLGAAEFPFLLRVNSRMQLRHAAFDSDGPNRDENNLEFERLRLLFSGFAFSTDLAYQMQLDADSDDHEQFELLDFFLMYDVGHAAWDCGPGRFGLKAGLYRLPYSRARQDSAWVLQFTDRTIASQFFDINRAIALGLSGTAELFGRSWKWETALSNGFDTSGSAPGRVNELDRNFGYSARVTTDLVGAWGTDGEPDLNYHTCPAVKVGCGFAFTTLDRRDGLDEFSSVPAFSDSGLNRSAADILPAAVQAFDQLLYAVDTNVKYQGISLHGEYYFRQRTDFAGAAVPDRFDHGFLLQSGYFLCREKLELLARWSHMVGNSGSLADSFHSSDELAAGIAWYLRGHNLKFVSDVTHVNGSPLDEDAINIRGGDDGWLVRTQFQIIF